MTYQQNQSLFFIFNYSNTYVQLKNIRMFKDIITILQITSPVLYWDMQDDKSFMTNTEWLLVKGSFQNQSDSYVKCLGFERKVYITRTIKLAHFNAGLLVSTVLSSVVIVAMQKVFGSLVNEGELEWEISSWRKTFYLCYELMASFVVNRSP